MTRPETSDNFTETTLNGAVAKGATSIVVTSATGFADYLCIGIETDEIVQDASGITGDNVTSSGRVIHWTFVDDSYASGTTIPISEKMPYAASSGLKVYLMNDDRFLGTNDVTVGSL